MSMPSGKAEHCSYRLSLRAKRSNLIAPGDCGACSERSEESRGLLRLRLATASAPRNDTLAPPWSSGMAGRLLYGPGRSSQTPPSTLRALAGFAHHHRSQPALHFLVNALVGLRQCFASKDAALLQRIASRAPQWYNSRAINARELGAICPRTHRLIEQSGSEVIAHGTL